MGENVLDTLRQFIDTSKIKNPSIPPSIQSNLTKLFEGQLDLYALDTKVLHSMVEGLSKILVKEKAGICVAIDNIDEYFRAMTEKFGEKYEKEEARNRVAANLLGAVRILTAGLEQIVVLLACTRDVYDQIMQARVDVTYGRRIEAQQRTLQELNPAQSLELVNKYLQWWSKAHDTKVPEIRNEECSVIDPSGQRVLLYPFSVNAVEYFHRVTREFPGDIVCLCGQCINDMRREGKISIVNGAAIYYALEEAKRLYPQLVLHADIIDRERPRYMKELMTKRLDIILKEMNRVGSDSRRIIDDVEKYRQELGISTAVVSSAKRYTDESRSIPLSDYSRIWEYKGKRILVKYIIGPFPPLGAAVNGLPFEKEIDWQDVVEARSFLEDEFTKVTHVLFLTRWAKPLINHNWLYGGGMDLIRPVFGEFNLDNAINNIAAAVEDNSEQRKDLIRHVDQYSANLLSTLDALVEKTKAERSLEFIRQKNKEAATSF